MFSFNPLRYSDQINSSEKNEKRIKSQLLFCLVRQFDEHYVTDEIRFLEKKKGFRIWI